MLNFPFLSNEDNQIDGKVSKYVLPCWFFFIVPGSNQSTLKNTDTVLALSSLSFGFERALAIASNAQ